MSFDGISLSVSLCILLAIAAVLVASHFLMGKYTRIVVPVTLFWSVAIKESRLAVFFGRFRYWLSFIFLFMLAMLLVFILTKPVSSESHAGVVYVVDGNGETLARARDLCRAGISLLPADTPVTLITVGEIPTVLVNERDTRLTALAAVDNIPLSDGRQSGMAQALLLADNIAQRDKACSVLVVSAVDHQVLIKSMKAAGQFHQYDPSWPSTKPVDMQVLQDKVYFSPDIPQALSAVLLASGMVQVVSEPEQADLMVISSKVQATPDKPSLIVVNSQQDIAAGERVFFSKFFSRCFAEGQAASMQTDLFTGSGGYLNMPEQGSVCLLESTNGSPLAYVTGMKTVYLSDALFASEASFWKQRQFVPVMSALMALILGHEIYGQATAVVPVVSGGELGVEPASIWERAQWYEIMIVVALLLLVIEFFLYCRRVLV